MQREKESAAEAAQALARDWAASKSDTSSSGNVFFHEISSGGTGASQPGVRSSLSNVFGYAKATPSEPTTAPTAGGYEGSQSSPPSRHLYHMDLYTPVPEGFGILPDGRAEVHSATAGVSDAAAAGRPIPPVRPQSPVVSATAGPDGLALVVVQTVTAPTVTARGQDRKPSPSKPSSSRDGDRKPGRDDKGGKKDDTAKDEDDKGPPKGHRSPPGGGPGKEDPDNPSLKSPTASLSRPNPKKWKRTQAAATEAGHADRVPVKQTR
jgi:hypothetical protein